MATTMTLTDPNGAGGTTPPKTPMDPEKSGSSRPSTELVPEIKDQEGEEVATDEAEGAEEDPDVVYPEGLPLILITVALCLAVFVIALDQTIIATAIPKITGMGLDLETLWEETVADARGNRSVQGIGGRGLVW